MINKIAADIINEEFKNVQNFPPHLMNAMLQAVSHAYNLGYDAAIKDQNGQGRKMGSVSSLIAKR